MTYDPNQPGWNPPPGGQNPSAGQWSSGAQPGSDPYAPPPGGVYQPPEGTNPGGYMPPPGAYPGGYPPPGAPPMGQPPYYGYGVYPGPMAASTSGWAIASLACSIASWVIVPILGAIAGVIFGHIALNEIKNAQGRVEGRGMAIAGLVIGYAHIAVGLCVAAFIIIAILASGAPTR
ncbi:MAG TPA: DUF4190 domain-containing protein [Ktedonobacterales bacterium]